MYLKAVDKLSFFGRFRAATARNDSLETPHISDVKEVFMIGICHARGLMYMVLFDRDGQLLWSEDVNRYVLSVPSMKCAINAFGGDISNKKIFFRNFKDFLLMPLATQVPIALPLNSLWGISEWNFSHYCEEVIPLLASTSAPSSFSLPLIDFSELKDRWWRDDLDSLCMHRRLFMAHRMQPDPSRLSVIRFEGEGTGLRAFAMRARAKAVSWRPGTGVLPLVQKSKSRAPTFSPSVKSVLLVSREIISQSNETFGTRRWANEEALFRHIRVNHSDSLRPALINPEHISTAEFIEAAQKAELVVMAPSSAVYQILYFTPTPILIIDHPMLSLSPSFRKILNDCNERIRFYGSSLGINEDGAYPANIYEVSLRIKECLSA
jgi:hypothetical protein